MQSSRLSAEAQAGFARPNNASGQKHASCCQYRAYRGEGPNHSDANDVVVLDEEEAVNSSGTKARIGVANTGCTRERAPTTVTLTTWLCWTKKKQCGSDASASRAQRRREWCNRGAWLSDGAGSGSSITKTQSAGRRPCADKWRNIVVDAQVMVM